FLENHELAVLSRCADVEKSERRRRVIEQVVGAVLDPDLSIQEDTRSDPPQRFTDRLRRKFVSLAQWRNRTRAVEDFEGERARHRDLHELRGRRLGRWLDIGSRVGCRTSCPSMFDGSGLLRTATSRRGCARRAFRGYGL